MTENTQPKQKQYGRPDNERVIDFMKIALPAAIISIILTGSQSGRSYPCVK